MRLGSREELIALPNRAGGPFGEEREGSWWRRLSEEPDRYTVPLALAGLLGAVGGIASNGTAKLLAMLPVLVVPVVLAREWLLRARARREQEQVLPELDAR